MAFLDNFFGFSFKKKAGQGEKLTSPVPSIDIEDVSVVSNSGFNSTYYNLDFNSNNKKTLIEKYRSLSLQSEVESAIDEIVNEAIVTGDLEQPVSISFKDIPYSEEIKEIIQEEFKKILSLLDFNENGYEIFKRWYVDGRLYFQILIDPNNINDGISELRFIDPRKIEKVKEIKEETTQFGIRVEKVVDEFYTYESGGLGSNGVTKLPLDSIVTTNSGIVDYTNGSVIISYLHKSIKPFNQLRMIEDALVIYRMARAPERRIFKIEIPPELHKGKGEQYLESLMNKYKSKIVYDSETGNLSDDTRSLSMLEDFWIPVRDGKGTDISTLSGGQNLGEIGDVDLFSKKLQRSLNVPLSRLNSDSSFNAGRTTEIEREEVKFSYFIKRLRTRFSAIFYDILKKQLMLKNVITAEDWEDNIKSNIFFDYRKDSHFAEYNESEITSRRIESASQAISLGEEYYTPNFIKKHFLKLTDEEIKEMDYERVENKKGDEGLADDSMSSSSSYPSPPEEYSSTSTGVSSFDDMEPTPTNDDQELSTADTTIASDLPVI